MSVVAILRAAPIATNTESMEPEAVTHFEMYARDALHPRPGRELTDIPVRVDHRKDVSVGRVTALRADTCVGGPRGTWQYVHVEISDPPPWLREGTPVSISRAAYSSRTPWDADWLLVQKAILSEVSILSPGQEPAHPAACVEWMGRREKIPESPATVQTTSDLAVAGDDFDDYRCRRTSPKRTLVPSTNSSEARAGRQKTRTSARTGTIGSVMSTAI